MKTEIKLIGSYAFLFILNIWLFNNLSNKINIAFHYESIEVIGSEIVIGMAIYLMLILNQLWYLRLMYYKEKDKEETERIERAKKITLINSNNNNNNN